MERKMCSSVLNNSKVFVLYSTFVLARFCFPFCFSTCVNIFPHQHKGLLFSLLNARHTLTHTHIHTPTLSLFLLLIHINNINNSNINNIPNSMRCLLQVFTRFSSQQMNGHNNTCMNILLQEYQRPKAIKMVGLVVGKISLLYSRARTRPLPAYFPPNPWVWPEITPSSSLDPLLLSIHHLQPLRG